LTSDDPISVTLDDAENIYWIIPIKDLGQLIGTSTGLRLLNPQATSFRLGIISSNDTIPSSIPPVVATINGVSGIIFVSADRSKLFFLQAVSQILSIQMLDLTQFFNAFESDPIKRVVQVPFLSDRMTAVLTEGGNLYRLVTGNNDKFSWSRDMYGAVESYNGVSKFPRVGFNKTFYLDTSTVPATRYTWSVNQYILTSQTIPQLMDITTYNNNFLTFFNVDAVDSAPQSIVMAKQDLVNDLSDLLLQTTVDFYLTTPSYQTQFLVQEQISNITLPDLQNTVIPSGMIPVSYLFYLLLPSKMSIETHYDEYPGSGNKVGSKGFNRRVENLIVTGSNLFNVIVGYNAAKQDYFGNYTWYTQDVYRRFSVQMPFSQPTNLMGNFAVRSSNSGLRLTIYINSYNIIPCVISTITYNLLFP
jgi:hypothetical protein